MKLLLKQLTLTITCNASLMGLIACQPISDSANSESTNSAESLPGQGVIVSSAVGIQEEKFQAEIVNIGLEKLGYKTEEIKQLDYPTMYVAIANQDLDFTAAYYRRGHIEFFENAGGSEKLERIGSIVDPVTQAYKIDLKTADEYNITNLEQLKDPKIAQQFDSDGDGKANLIGCNTGWRCERVIDHHIDVYGLRDTVEQDSGSYFALIADGITRYNQGEPILFYTWTPLWVSSVLKEGQDVISLEVPYTDLPGALDQYREKDTTVNGKNMGLLIEQAAVLGNHVFLSANPAAKRFFELVQVPVEDVSAENELIQQGENKPEDIRRHAEEWVQNNQQLFDSWVEAAKEADE
ncbi:MAG: glycine betaine/L-proline ABC transporter substrate-binding protein ProX [Cyanobacteria bacterium J06592_8]